MKKNSFLISIIFIFLCKFIFSMEIVIFKSDRALLVEKIEYDKNFVLLHLPGGNKIGCPLNLIEKIYAGYVPLQGEEIESKTLKIDVPFKDIIIKACQKEEIDVKLIISVIKVESNFNQYAVSPKGAKGLMQLMPSVINDYNVKNAFDPKENIFTGVKYLKKLINECEGDLGLALAAYNAGLKRVKDAEGLPEISETKEYVAKILSIYSSLEI